MKIKYENLSEKHKKQLDDFIEELDKEYPKEVRDIAESLAIFLSAIKYNFTPNNAAALENMARFMRFCIKIHKEAEEEIVATKQASPESRIETPETSPIPSLAGEDLYD